MRARAVGTIGGAAPRERVHLRGRQGGQGTPSPDPTPRGGTLRIAAPDSRPLLELDPQRAYDAPEWEVLRCCLLRTLYSYNGRPTSEGGAEPRPDLAVGPPEVSADGLTWTSACGRGFATRRLSMTRSSPPSISSEPLNGPPGSARTDDYFEPIGGFSDYASGAADSIAGLEARDDRTLVVRLDEVTGDLVYRFSLAATAPIPEGADEGHDEDYARYVVASGPYMVEGSERLDFTAPPDEQAPTAGFTPAVLDEDGALIEPGSLVLVQNPSWDPATDQLRAAYADRIEFTLGGQDEAEIAQRVDRAEVDLGFPTRRSSRSPGIATTRTWRDGCSWSRDATHLVGDDEPRRSALRRRSRPPRGGARDRPGGARRAALRAAVRSVRLQLGRGRDAHGPRRPRRRAPASVRSVSLRPRGGAEEMRAVRTTIGPATAGATRRSAGTSRLSSWMKGCSSTRRGRSATTWRRWGSSWTSDPVPGAEFFGGASIHDPTAADPDGDRVPVGSGFPEGAGWFPPLFERQGWDRYTPEHVARRRHAGLSSADGGIP